MEYSFILVEPKVPENIGASARALKTMGFSSLILINPCPDPEGKSKWLAHGSHDILDNVLVYNSMKEVVNKFDILIATTTRKRKLQADLIAAEGLKEYLGNKGNSIAKVAIVFGNEESGLSNHDLSLCHVSSEIPLAVGFPSLNLSQAVMIYAYELSNTGNEIKHSGEKPVSGQGSYRIINDKVDELLSETGLSDNPALSGKIKERLAKAGEKDLNLIHTVISAVLKIIRKIK